MYGVSSDLFVVFPAFIESSHPNKYGKCNNYLYIVIWNGVYQFPRTVVLTTVIKQLGQIKGGHSITK